MLGLGQIASGPFGAVVEEDRFVSLELVKDLQGRVTWKSFLMMTILSH